jgi:hypothetical protein
MSGHGPGFLERLVSLHDLQAPAADGGVLIHPSFERGAELAERNARQLDHAAVSLLDKPLSEVRRLARDNVEQQVGEYFRETGEPLPASQGGPWFLAGHQPELFHPGVWLKNFVLHALARRQGGTCLNLIVDSDTARHPFIRVPAQGRLLPVPFDHWHSEIPFEQRDVADEPLFAAFPGHVAELTAAWPFQPTLGDFWIDVMREAVRTRSVTERLVRARRRWERRLGLDAVELPVGRLCRTEAFAWFACAVLSEAERFRDAYNGAVADYRHRYGLRSRNHPVPDLARDGDWVEVPFWGWRRENPRRQRLYGRRRPQGIELRCGAETWPALRTDTPAAMVRSWLELERGGMKVRTRALSLTLFCRLCLADLFVHGLGGGKYDEVTDAITRRFFRVEPPAFMVVTGTLRLPLPLHDVNDDDPRRLAWRLRDLAFNPQRHIAPRAKLSPSEQELFFAKAVLMKHEPVLHKERKDRFFQMRQINEALQPLVAPEKERTLREKEEAGRLLEENATTARRDFAFCLHPEEKLRPFLRSALPTKG